MAGVALELADLRAAKEAAPGTPVLANTGVRPENVAETLRWADGAIVGTSVKVDGHIWNPVDRGRVERLVAAAGEARGGQPARSRTA